MDLAQLIKSRRFDDINKDIVSGIARFKQESIRAKNESDYKLFQISKDKISFEEVDRMIQTSGFVPANVYELLSWKGWDGASTVAAIGSTTEVDGVKYTVCMSLDHFREPDKYYSMKRLCLLEINRDWKGEMYFLGVRA